MTIHPNKPISDEALQASEAMYRTLFEHSPIGILYADAKGTYLDANRAVCEMLGYSREELIGMHAGDIVAPSEVRHIRTALDEIHSQTGHQREWRFRRKDGTFFEAEVTATTFPDGTVLALIRDVSVLREHERELERLSRLYSALSQINQAIVFSENRDELFRKVCAALVEQGGLLLAWVGLHDEESKRIVRVASHGDADGYADQVEIHTDERPTGRGPSGSAFRTGKPCFCNDALQDAALAPWRDELVRRGFHSVAALPIRCADRVVGVIHCYADTRAFFHDKERSLLEEAATDISFALDSFARDEAKRLAEQALESEKHFADMMIESMPGIVYFYDSRGRFLRWNKNFEIVTGYTGAEIAAMHPRDFFKPEEHPRLNERIAEVFATGESWLEALFLAKDGTTTDYFFTGRRVQYNGQPCLVGVGIDISKRIRTEQALHELNTRLEAIVTERTEALQVALARAETADQIKSAFLATMSHELRTPLNSIIGFTGIILQKLAGPLNEEQTKQLNMVLGSARHLLALVNDVLDISKIEAGQLTISLDRFDLSSSIERVLSTVAPMAEKKHLKLERRLEPNLGAIFSDQRRFEQILINLLSNAIKFTERGGINVEAARIAGWTPQGGAVKRPAVRISVADTGCGIKSAELGSLFQPFRQLDSGLSRSHEGTGLGLAICRRLTELMGGTIHVESEWRKGSVFTLTLPLQGPKPL